mgnify:CR=1 FL=1|jgi:hypothetical protein
MKLPVIISSVVGIFALIGGLYAFDCNYTRAEDHNNLHKDHAQLENRFERQLLQDDARNLQRRMWDMQREYGDVRAKKSQEYKEVKSEREMIMIKLNQK